MPNTYTIICRKSLEQSLDDDKCITLFIEKNSDQQAVEFASGEEEIVEKGYEYFTVMGHVRPGNNQPFHVAKNRRTVYIDDSCMPKVVENVYIVVPRPKRKERNQFMRDIGMKKSIEDEY